MAKSCSAEYCPYEQIFITIKRGIVGNIIKTEELTSKIKQFWICGVEWGGSRKGFPREMMPLIIKGLEERKKIKKINRFIYQILP